MAFPRRQPGEEEQRPTTRSHGRARSETGSSSGTRSRLVAWSHFLAENRRPLFREMLLIGEPGGDVARDPRALVEVAANGEIGGRRAGPVGLLKAAIAAVEARRQALPPLAARRLGLEQRLHLVAPDLALVGAAQAAQVMQCAEDLGK